MRGSKSDRMKNMAISLLIGIVAATNLTWRDTVCMVGGGYITAQVAWVFLTTYDEIQRKRRVSRHGKN